MAYRSRKQPGKRHIVHGLDPWKTAGGEELCHWDLWMLTLLVEDHQGDWVGLRQSIKKHRKKLGNLGGNVEGMTSHLDDLRQRLEQYALTPGELLGDLTKDWKKILKKARTKVFEQETPGSDKSEAMQNTPRRRLKVRALRGNWKPFPVSPIRYESIFKSEMDERRFYHESATFNLSHRLDTMLAQKTRVYEEHPAEILALYRAFLTVVLEAQDRIDDSSGEIGDSFGQAFRRYLSIPWSETGITPEAFWRDFLEFTVWEDYGMTPDDDVAVFFETMEPEQVPLVEKILREIREEFFGWELEYQAEEALSYIGMLCVAQKQIDRFPELAEEMGSRAWKRITSMAEAAVKAHRRDVAEAVFEAADQPGSHRNHLKEKRRALLRKAGQP